MIYLFPDIDSLGTFSITTGGTTHSEALEKMNDKQLDHLTMIDNVTDRFRGTISRRDFRSPFSEIYGNLKGNT
ncbi:MAG: hypothetical protein ACJ71P_17290 [Nitrososphaeraceae archaeon]